MHRTLTATVLAGFLIATAPSGLFDHFWDLLSTFWDTACVTTDEGCGWDPNGGDTSTSDEGDAGRGWDPNGGESQLQNTQAKVGCTFDPDGRCTPKP
jgi:hypothetical protein